MNFWQYILQPTNASLGPMAMAALLVSVLGLILGIALIVLPREFAQLLASRSTQHSRGRLKEVGLEERRLRAELRVKAGAGIAVWCTAFIIALLLRLLGTPGLDTRLLPSLVVLTLPFLIGYVIVYRLFLYPRYLEGSRRIDSNRSYTASAKKNKKAAVTKPGKEKISLAPGKAMIGLAIAPFIYYIVMVAVSVPPSVQPQNHDHLLHQLGMPVIALLGYLIGLMVSLGEEIRSLLPWLKLSRK